jgi:hypothetical protein
MTALPNGRTLEERAANGNSGSVFAVKRGLSTAHHDVAVHEAGIGHFWTFPAATCGAESRHSPEIDGKLPYFRSLASSGYRLEGSQYQRLATRFQGNMWFLGCVIGGNVPCFNTAYVRPIVCYVATRTRVGDSRYATSCSQERTSTSTILRLIRSTARRPRPGSRRRLE